MSLEWHGETWRQRGANFLVEVKHWKDKGLNINSGQNETQNRWNVYAYIFPKHPLFEEIKTDELFVDHVITGFFHYGLSYHEWNCDKNGKVISKQLGSDYQHIYDSYEQTENIKITPTLSDAKELFEYLNNFKPKETEG